MNIIDNAYDVEKGWHESNKDAIMEWAGKKRSSLVVVAHSIKQ